MSKKTMLLALAVAAMLAIPSAASAQEVHIKGVTTFSVSGSAGSVSAFNEPKISCAGGTIGSGSFDAGSSTTGSVSLTFSGCAAEFLGIKGSCSNGVNGGEIKFSGSFHLITVSTGAPGILVTPSITTIICLGFSRVEVTGNGVIGTITSPKCGGSSNTLGITFELTAGGPTQKHLTYTGGTFDLSAHTEGSSGSTTGASGTAGLQASATLSSGTAGTLECT